MTIKMYLILPTEEAKERNALEALKRGCKHPTTAWWSTSQINNNMAALHVMDGDGLTDSELEMCVDELPQEAP